MRYELHGTTMQTLAIDLPRGETLYSQTASMAWMTENVAMDTNTGGGLFAGLKRAIAGADCSSPNSPPKPMRTSPSPRASPARSSPSRWRPANR